MNIKGLHTLRSNAVGIMRKTVTFKDMCTEMDKVLFGDHYLPELEVTSDGKIFYRTKTKIHTDLIFEDVHWLLFTKEGKFIEESINQYAELPEYPCYIVRMVNNKRYVSREVTYIIDNMNVAMQEVQTLHGIEFSCDNADVSSQIKTSIMNTIENLEFE